MTSPYFAGGDNVTQSRGPLQQNAEEDGEYYTDNDNDNDDACSSYSSSSWTFAGGGSCRSIPDTAVGTHSSSRGQKQHQAPPLQGFGAYNSTTTAYMMSGNAPPQQNQRGHAGSSGTALGSTTSVHFGRGGFRAADGGAKNNNNNHSSSRTAVNFARIVGDATSHHGQNENMDGNYYVHQRAKPGGGSGFSIQNENFAENQDDLNETSATTKFGFVSRSGGETNSINSSSPSVGATPSPYTTLSAEAEAHRIQVEQQNKKRNKRTWDGVFLPVSISVFGVVLFIRLPWIVGQAGLLLSLLAIFLCYLASGLTTVSMAAISTNGFVGDGGPYMMISRCLGPQVGIVIGITFVLANAVSSGMYLIGSAGIIAQILPWDALSEWIATDKYIVTLLISSAMLGLLLIIAFLSIEKPFRICCILLTLISIVDIIVAMTSERPKPSIGFTGPSLTSWEQNIGPDFSSNSRQPDVNFQTVVSVLFPGVTGVMSGVCVSGELVHTAKAIPKGIGYAWIASLTIYTSMTFIIASSFNRAYLRSNFGILNSVGHPWLFYPGEAVACFAAVLAMLGGSIRVLQAMAKDDLLRSYLLRIIGSSTTKNATLFYGIVVQLILFAGDTYQPVSLIAAQIYCCNFAALNLSTFVSSVSGVVSFRPIYRFFNKFTALLGTLVNLGLMFFMSPVMAVGFFVCVIALIVLVDHYVDTSSIPWGDASQPIVFHLVRKWLLRLDERKEHIRHWRPSILMICTDPLCSLNLIHLINNLKKGGLFELGLVVQGDFVKTSVSCFRWKGWLMDYIGASKIKAFAVVTFGDTLRAGVQSLLRTCGLGGMKPNTVVISLDEFLQRDAYCDAYKQYTNVIEDARMEQRRHMRRQQEDDRKKKENGATTKILELDSTSNNRKGTSGTENRRRTDEKVVAFDPDLGEDDVVDVGSPLIPHSSSSSTTQVLFEAAALNSSSASRADPEGSQNRDFSNTHQIRQRQTRHHLGHDDSRTKRMPAPGPAPAPPPPPYFQFGRRSRMPDSFSLLDGFYKFFKLKKATARKATQPKRTSTNQHQQVSSESESREQNVDKDDEKEQKPGMTTMFFSSSSCLEDFYFHGGGANFENEFNRTEGRGWDGERMTELQKSYQRRGFHYSPLSPQEMFYMLYQRALCTELETETVVGDEEGQGQRQQQGSYSLNVDDCGGNNESSSTMREGAVMPAQYMYYSPSSSSSSAASFSSPLAFPAPSYHTVALTNIGGGGSASPPITIREDIRNALSRTSIVMPRITTTSDLNGGRGMGMQQYMYNGGGRLFGQQRGTPNMLANDYFLDSTAATTTAPAGVEETASAVDSLASNVSPTRPWGGVGGGGGGGGVGGGSLFLWRGSGGRGALSSPTTPMSPSAFNSQSITRGSYRTASRTKSRKEALLSSASGIWGRNKNEDGDHNERSNSIYSTQQQQQRSSFFARISSSLGEYLSSSTYAPAAFRPTNRFRRRDDEEYQIEKMVMHRKKVMEINDSKRRRISPSSSTAATLAPDLASYETIREFCDICADSTHIHMNLVIARNIDKLDKKAIEKSREKVFIDLWLPDEHDAVVFLMGYSLSRTSVWHRNAVLRVVSVVSFDSEVEEQNEAMAKVLKDHRIDAITHTVSLEMETYRRGLLVRPRETERVGVGVGVGTLATVDGSSASDEDRSNDDEEEEERIDAGLAEESKRKLLSKRKSSSSRGSTSTDLIPPPRPQGLAVIPQHEQIEELLREDATRFELLNSIMRFETSHNTAILLCRVDPFVRSVAGGGKGERKRENGGKSKKEGSCQSRSRGSRGSDNNNNVSGDDDESDSLVKKREKELKGEEEEETEKRKGHDKPLAPKPNSDQQHHKPKERRGEEEGKGEEEGEEKDDGAHLFVSSAHRDSTIYDDEENDRDDDDDDGVHDFAASLSGVGGLGRRMKRSKVVNVVSANDGYEKSCTSTCEGSIIASPANQNEGDERVLSVSTEQKYKERSLAVKADPVDTSTDTRALKDRPKRNFTKDKNGTAGNHKNSRAPKMKEEDVNDIDDDDEALCREWFASLVALSEGLPPMLMIAGGPMRGQASDW